MQTCIRFFQEWPAKLQALGMTQSTWFFNVYFRAIIKDAVNATDSDALIFVGSGTTGAIHKLIHNINLSEPPVS